MKEKFMQPVVETQERPETKVEKLFGNLEEQYLDQVKVLNETGLIELLPESGEIGFYDIEGNERVLPDYEALVEHLDSKIEIIEQKYPQGFTQLQLTPFGMPLGALADKVSVFIRLKSNAGELLKTKKDSSDEDVPFVVDDKMAVDYKHTFEGQGSQHKGEVLYYPSRFEFSSGGQSKETIMAESDQSFPGWNILLLEDMPTLPKLGEQKEVGGRMQIESGKSAYDYLVDQQKDPSQAHEVFLTPEDWLTYFVSYLKNHNQVIDGFNRLNRDEGMACIQAGVYLTKNFVPVSFWYSKGSMGRVWINSRTIDYGNEEGGIRAAVKL